MIRLGLCCLYAEEPVHFRTVTASGLGKLERSARLPRVSAVCLHNVETLLQALHIAVRLKIGAFRIMSPLFPRYTHPEAGYTLNILPDAGRITAALQAVNRFRREHGLRLSFHPDQFVVLNSPSEDVVSRSIAEVEYQALLSQAVGAENINLHVGGAYGNKAESLARFAKTFDRLSLAARKRLTLENDDSVFTPADIMPLCRALRIPLVYDVHHHRCNPDGLSEAAATEGAVETWARLKREPHFHISSPRGGWEARNPRPHADYIDPADVPQAWASLDALTVDVEAKAKEKAVVRLQEEWPFTASGRRKPRAAQSAPHR